MHGNVWELPRDWYEANRTESVLHNPTGPATGSYKMRKGGSFYNGSNDQRSATRGNPTGPTYRNHTIGFRISLQRLPHLVELNSNVSLEMIWVEPGTFTMGSPTSEAGRGSDETETQVTLTQGFYLGKYEVTQAQYEAVMTDNNALSLIHI